MKDPNQMKDQKGQDASASKEIAKATLPVALMFQPTRFEVITGDRLKEWEALLKTHVGLEVNINPAFSGTYTLSMCGPDWDPCDSDQD